MARPALIVVAAALALVVGGIVAALVGDGGVASLTVALCAIGLGLILLTGLFFYEVGRSEDRDRARHPFG